LLPLLLKEKGGNPEDFIKMCKDEDSIDVEIKGTKAPRIIGIGDFWCLDPMCIAVEGTEVLSLGSTSMANVLELLVACYYVFNTMYPSKCSNAFLFCEAALLDKQQEARKRVTVNKFIAVLS